jgi:hypothetical protein
MSALTGVKPMMVSTKSFSIVQTPADASFEEEAMSDKSYHHSRQAKLTAL